MLTVGPRPSVGHSSCFIAADGNQRLFYFHIPVFLLMLVNVFLYLVPITNLNRHNRQTRAVRQSRRCFSEDLNIPLFANNVQCSCGMYISQPAYSIQQPILLIDRWLAIVKSTPPQLHHKFIANKEIFRSLVGLSQSLRLSCL